MILYGFGHKFDTILLSGMKFPTEGGVYTILRLPYTDTGSLIDYFPKKAQHFLTLLAK